jgi:hypothetical protein
MTQNDRLRNNHCEHGCELGSPNCAFHVIHRECSACKIRGGK